jgi:hypothetical protein
VWGARGACNRPPPPLPPACPPSVLWRGRDPAAVIVRRLEKCTSLLSRKDLNAVRRRYQQLEVRLAALLLPCHARHACRANSLRCSLSRSRCCWRLAASLLR